MSTKVAESCPKCTTSTCPTDDRVHVKKKEVYVKFWRYVCGSCSWVWANDVQRTHNDKQWDKTHRMMHSNNGWFN